MTQQLHNAKAALAPVNQSLESPLLFISFFTGIKGNCPAEWADDKIRVLEHAGRKTLVLTGMGSHVSDRGSIRYVRVPSLSWNDYKEEVKELQSAGEAVPLGMRLFMPFAFLLGNVIDFILRKITKGISAGRWSWVFTALIVALWLKLRHGARDVFCTGGPTSAHVVGNLAIQLTGGRLFCEFQDPLLGATMTRSSMTRRIATRIESWLVKSSTQAVYVTREAAQAARGRNPAQANHIAAVYPGAWQFTQPRSSAMPARDGVLEFLHLGTLYGTRNLDLLFKALDELRAEGFSLAHRVRVVNLGAIYCETAASYRARADFQLLDALERADALARAQQAACLMLIQHTDERSRETIPYKTYDYLNLGLPVFGLLNNDELRALIEAHGGHTAQADDLDAIKLALRTCLPLLADSNAGTRPAAERLDISRQFLQVLESANVGL